MGKKISEEEVKLLGPPGIPSENTKWDLPKVIPPPIRKKEQAVLPGHKRPVTILRDHTLDFPELWGVRVFILPDPDVEDDEARFIKMFARARCQKAHTIEDADLVVFAGGSDVDPALYGERRHEMTFYDEDRDNKDIEAFLACQNAGIPMLGICRGAQFLHVMNGGKLFQHVDNHMGEHHMYDLRRKQNIDRISSVHHQMVRDAWVSDGHPEMEILAKAWKSQTRHMNPSHSAIGIQNSGDIEAFWYRENCCIGIQGHPEYEGFPFFTKWCLELLEDLIINNPDLKWIGKGRDARRRIDPEILAKNMTIKVAKENN